MNHNGFNIEMQDVKVDPIRIVEPRVQLIGYTKFIPPFDVDSDDPAKLQMEPHEFATDSESIIEFAGRGCYRSWDRPNKKTATIEGYMENIIDHRHLSIMRHAQVSFYITGISRSFSHEMVTHAHIARSQESQRFVPADKINVVLPPLIRNWPGIKDENGEWHANEFSEMTRFARNTYARLVRIFNEAGVTGKKARQAARGVLPNAVETRMTVSGNMQAWLEFLTKRESFYADEEFQIVAEMIWHHLVGLAPSIFDSRVRMIWDQEFREKVEARLAKANAELDALEAEEALAKIEAEDAQEIIPGMEEL